MWHVWVIAEVLTGFWCRNLSDRGRFEELSVDWRIILRFIKERGCQGAEWFDLI